MSSSVTGVRSRGAAGRSSPANRAPSRRWRPPRSRAGPCVVGGSIESSGVAGRTRAARRAMPCSIRRSMTKPIGSTTRHINRWDGGQLSRCRTTSRVRRPPSIGRSDHCHVATASPASVVPVRWAASGPALRSTRVVGGSTSWTRKAG